MATTVDYIEYVCEQIKGNYAVRYKKCSGNIWSTSMTNLYCSSVTSVYVKMLNELSELMTDAEIGIPYDGSKENIFSTLKIPTWLLLS